MIGKKRSFKSSSCVDKAIEKPDVDCELRYHTDYEVMAADDGKYMSCYLMKSDCGKNNNKYYIIQVLRNTKSNQIYIHTRYGRVGQIASNENVNSDNIAAATKVYLKTFKQKTGSAKGYTAIEMKLGKDTSIESKVEKIKESDNQYKPSKLCNQV